MRLDSLTGRSHVSAMLGALLLVGTALAPDQAPADESAYIAGIVFLGSGCPSGSATAQLVDLDGDGLPDQFTISFSEDYVAAQGPGIGIVQQRRNCNLLVRLHLPDDYQVGVVGQAQAGYADLREGVGGTQRTDYVFPFYSDTVSRETVLAGPFKDYYQRQDGSDGEGLVWSPCGLDAPLNIRTEVYLQGDGSVPAAMSLDYVAPYLIWRRCDAAGAGRRPTGAAR